MSGKVRFETGTVTEMPALEPLLFELQREGRSGRHVRGGDAADALIPDAFKRTVRLPLPELSEPQVVRHTRTSRSSTTPSMPACIRSGPAR